jgi:hypothetical protein
MSIINNSSINVEPIGIYPLKCIKPIEFETPEEFIKYYNENKALLDSMTTCELNKRFNIKNLYIYRTKDINNKYIITLSHKYYKSRQTSYDILKREYDERFNKLEARIEKLNQVINEYIKNKPMLKPIPKLPISV